MTKREALEMMMALRKETKELKKLIEEVNGAEKSLTDHSGYFMTIFCMTFILWACFIIL